jgi:phenylalanyl-tRNA synthetase beta chain
MRVSLSWLRDYVDLPADKGELERLLGRLELAGLAIDTVLRPWEGARAIVAGVVKSVRPLPESDKLRVAEVDIGSGTVLTLVSGAGNFSPGDVVPVAPVGGSLPGGAPIAAEAIKGVVSQGMMCSSAELGLAVGPEAEAGIMILDSEIRPGTDLTGALSLDDAVLELDLTPNYAAYCQSMLGVAREVAALTGGRVREPWGAGPSGEGGPGSVLAGPLSATGERDLATGEAAKLAMVAIEAPDLCDRYSGGVFAGLRAGPSPWWMQRRLIAAGVRPVSHVVDVTNYVMLELGQPLHAFDLDLVQGRAIVVRRAAEGETLVTLDGVERRLLPDDLVIADSERAIALAGVMGGANTEINPRTDRVFLESAHFSPTAVRRTSRRLGLRSEASGRFEKGLDPSTTVRAIELASELLCQGAARRVPGLIDVVARPSPLRVIAVSTEYARTLVGVPLAGEEMRGLLARVGIEAEPGGDGRDDETLLVTVPARRPDMDVPADVVEEIARSYGYDRIPGALPGGDMPSAGLPPKRQAVLDAGEVLRGYGLNELLTFSYHPAVELDKMTLPCGHPWREAIPIANPMNEEQALLRRSLVPNLLRVLSYNALQGVSDLHGYEISRVFLPHGLPLTELPAEPLRLAIAVAGSAPGAANWRGQGRQVDFYLVKGIIEGLAASMGLGPLDFSPGTTPITLPGRSATVSANGTEIGWLGEVAGPVMEAYGLKKVVYLAELDFDAMYEMSGDVRLFEGLPRYPAVQRDLAFVVPDEVPAAEIERLVSAAGGELLVQTALFDVYQGKPVPRGHRSLAYALSFRSRERTLTDEEVDAACQRIVLALREVGAVLRS